MFFELLAAVIAGIGAAGVAVGIRKLSKGAIPGFAIPIAAGLGMLSAAIWSEYDWYPHQVDTLGDEFAVAATFAEPSPFRPWTYLRPFVSRFMAVHIGGAQRNQNAPGQVIVDVVLFQRYAPQHTAPVLIDCIGARRADLSDGASFGADGAVVDARWVDVGGGDPLVSTVCAAS